MSAAEKQVAPDQSTVALEENVSVMFDATKDLDANSTDELNLSRRVTGQVDSLRNSILTFVADKQYEVAIREIRMYQKFKSDLEIFKTRTERHFDLGEELIESIRTLLATPDLKVLPMSKRQLIYERVVTHFESLKMTLDKLEKVENDIKIRDVRFTVWVLQVSCAAIGTLIAIVALNECIATLGRPMDVLYEDVSHFLMNSIGL